ncbi:hypothetical protein GCM10011339_21070 [Echinicola rosea]|uniref:Uncharacterized protein n=1 Tax=Echinicola rosea TaxID=1807691 RepID=A0ABQ1V2J0_9BACT|nr:hypothetical protein GCM10011339_21070 [Echinicola rosea]
MLYQCDNPNRMDDRAMAKDVLLGKLNLLKTNRVISMIASWKINVSSKGANNTVIIKI